MKGLMITEKAVLNGPRIAGRLRKRPLELDGQENVVSKWTVDA